MNCLSRPNNKAQRFAPGQPVILQPLRSAILTIVAGTGSHALKAAIVLICCLFAWTITMPSGLAQTTADAKSLGTAGLQKEQFIPADQLDALFQRDQHGVLIPRDQFQDLLQKANQAAALADQQPATIVAEQVDLQVRPDGQQAIVVMEIHVRHFARDWQALTLPAGNLLIEKVEVLDTADTASTVKVARDPDNRHQLQIVSPQPQKFIVRLTMSTPLALIGSDRSAAFQLPQVASTRLSVECPAGQYLLINDLKSDRPAPIEGATTYQLPLGYADQVRLRWTTQKQQNESQTLVFVNTEAATQIQEEAIRWRSSSSVSIFGGTINQLVARVPSRLEITNIESTGLESWKLEDDPDAADMTRVTLAYRQPFAQDRLVQISGIAAIAAESQQRIPTLEFIDVTSHSGRLVVSHESGLRLTAQTGAGIRTTAADYGQTRPSYAVSVFDFWVQQFDLTVAVKPRDRELFGELVSNLSLQDRTATFSSILTIETLSAPLFDLKLTLPADWQMVSLTSDETQVDWRSASSENQILVTPQNPVAAGELLQLSIILMRTIADPESEQKLELPVVTPFETTIANGTYSIEFASDLSVAPVTMTGLEPIGGSPTSLSFRNVGTKLSGQVSILRKRSHLAGRSILRTWADARQLATDLEINVDVMHGTVPSLTVYVSESLGDDIHFRVTGTGPIPGFESLGFSGQVNIIEQTSRPVEDGMRPFDLKLSQRFAGSLGLTASARKPRELLAEIPAPIVRIDNALRQHGILVFEAFPEQQLKSLENVDHVGGLFEADAGLVDSPDASTGRRVALTYRFVQPDYQFSVQETRFETEPVPSAVITQIHNDCLLNDSGAIQRSCEAAFQSSGVQTVRFTLPDAEQSFLWSTMLNSEPVEVRRDGDDYLVAVPLLANGTNGINEYSLSMVFETHASGPGGPGHIDQKPVRFAIDTGDSQPVDINVLRQSWDVHYPQTSLLVDSTGFLNAVDGTDQPGWCQQLLRLELPAYNTIIGRLVPLVIFLLGAFVFTVLSIQRRGKMMAVLVICGILLFGVLSSFVSQERAASEYFTESAKDSVAATSQPIMPGHAGWEADDYAGEVADSSGNAAAGRSATDRFGTAFRADSPLRESASGNGRTGRSVPPVSGEALRIMGSTTITFNGDAQQSANIADSITVPQGVQRGLKSSPNIELGTIAPQAPIQSPQNADPFAATIPQPDAATLGDAAFNIAGLVDASLRPNRKGSARLSVQVGLEVPADYQSREFRSVGDPITTPSPLQIVVLSEQQIAAMRIIAALCMVIAFWWLRNARPSTCSAASIVVFLSAAALIPFVSNQWQCVLDGILIGSIFGCVIWLLRWMFCKFSSQRIAFRQQFPDNALKATGTVVSLMLMTFAESPILVAQEPATVSDNTLNPSVVVPYAADQPALRANKVFIEQQAFEKLFALAYPELRPSGESAPATSAVIAAFYQADKMTPVSGKQHVLQVNARYVVFHQSEAAAQIPLPLGNVAIRTAQVDGQPGIVQPIATIAVQNPKASADLQHASGYSIAVTGKGSHVVDITFDIPAELEGGAGRLEIPFRPVTAGTLELTLPEAFGNPAVSTDEAAQLPASDYEVRVNGRSNIFRQDGRTIIIPIADSVDTRIQWQPATIRTSGDVVFHAASTSALIIHDAGMEWISSIEITCRQGNLSELNIQIPEGYSVQSVSGNDVAGWSVQNTDSTRSVKLQLKREVDDKTLVDLQLFAESAINEEKASITVPVPVVRGATRDMGTIALLAGSQFQVRSESLSGVTQLNPQDATLPEKATLAEQSPTVRRLLAWRFTRHPAVISVRTTRTTDKAAVTALHALRLETQRQLWTSQFDLRISGSPQSRFDIIVPQGFLALDVQATGITDWFLDSLPTTTTEQPDNTRVLRIQLQRATVGTIHIVIQGQFDRPTDHTSLTMLAPYILQATEATAQLAVWLDAASENAGMETGNWILRQPSGIADNYRQLVQSPPSVAFFTSRNAPGPVTLKLRKAVPTLIAESVTVTNATDTSIDLTLALNWQIARAAADTFVVELPSAVASTLHFDVPDQRRLLKEDLGNGKTRITIQLQQPVKDRLFVLATGNLPLPDDGIVKAQAPLFTNDVSQTVDNQSSVLSGQSHFWVVVNQSSGLLQPAADHHTTEVATSLITTSIPSELLDLAVSVQRLNDKTPVWNLKFPQQHHVSPAVVTLATHTTVIAEDASWRSRHTLNVRNESRQFLPVQIPKDSRMLYCLVQNIPTRIVVQQTTNETRHLIPIPQGGAIAASFDVEFALAGQLPGAADQVRDNWSRSKLRVPVPEFPEFRDDSEFGISISRNRWSIYVPDSWQATLLEDPGLTNVIPANEQDLADASLLSSVEQTNWLLNSIKSATNSVAKQNLYRELQIQKLSIETMTGNSDSVLQERDEVLGKLQSGNDILYDNLNDATSLNSADAGETLYYFGNNPHSNRWLFEQDMNQNGLLLRNDASFLMNNRVRGLQEELDSKPQTFNFQLSKPQLKLQTESDDLFHRYQTLPQINVKDKESVQPGSRDGLSNWFDPPTNAAHDDSLKEQEELNRKGTLPFTKGGEQKPGKLAEEPATGNRSRLMQRRQSGINAPDSELQMPESQALGLMRAQRGNPYAEPDASTMPPDASMEKTSEIEFSEGLGESKFGDESSQPTAIAESTGQLSLQFEIPTEGQRLDFIRPGGNPNLTITVQSQKIMKRGYGLLWAMVCLAVALLLAAATRLGQGIFWSRVLLTGSASAVAGWLLSPAQWTGLFVMLSIAFVTGYCASVIILQRAQR